jgi:UDP-N-acetylmuramyl tripeptide synthase
VATTTNGRRDPGAPLPVRTRLAAMATRAANTVSRRAHLGSGTVAGGRVGLAIDPDLVMRLVGGRPVALVTGTNGKTTTTRLVAAGLEGGGLGPVVSNITGANMPAGHAAALCASDADRGATVVLEVDERYLPMALEETAARCVVLLNLSRDQLDRTNEVRMTAGRWREALATPGPVVVANADDPLVVWGAGSAPDDRWVAAGLRWQADAVGCPSCAGRIVFTPEGWRCDCGFARPTPDVSLETRDGRAEAVWPDGRRRSITPALPGEFNLANVLMAAVAAEALGAPVVEALAATERVDAVAGRFTIRTVGGVRTRLLLAKNPAGWAELLELVGHESGPVVVAINARVADGRDPSWLWDVPFERLRGRPVVATGERYRDLAVRLRYADVVHSAVADPHAALQQAASDAGAAAGDAPIEFIGNYTAFHDLLKAR